MADYFTHFSCVLDAGTPEKAVQALDLHTRLCAEGEASDDPNYSAFVLRLAAEMDLTGLWGFDYALTCSRPRLEAFGGGAHVIDLGARKSVGWTSCQEWLAAALNGEDAHA